MNLEYTLRILAFSRNRYLDEKYPLDSNLFMDSISIHKYHGILDITNNDYVCTGVIMFNVNKYESILADWFFQYPKDTQTITGGEQPILVYELLKLNELNMLPYEYQAIWTYEISHKYPFLFKNLDNEELVRSCIEACLISNNFLLFCRFVERMSGLEKWRIFQG